MIRLPGLIDPHVHLREPGATHKEDWDSGTAAALAGGFTTVLAMPNTRPPILDAASLDLALSAASQKARCDFAQYIGASSGNAQLAASLADRAAALKMYLDSTFGELRLEDMSTWGSHFSAYPPHYPIVVHAEGRTLAAAILFAAIHKRHVHVAHVSSAEEILLIKAAKESGLPVSCEVAPHHLFLTRPGSNANQSVAGRLDVRPSLGTQHDVDALWANLAVIDCFATDHAPHTLTEKDSPQPPPGFPGLETALPLLLTAVKAGRLTMDDLIHRMHTRPREIFLLPAQPETWIEVDEQDTYRLRASEHFTRCGWTPFEGWQVTGRVRRVVLRGAEAFKDGQVLAAPGSGMNVRV